MLASPVKYPKSRRDRKTGTPFGKLNKVILTHQDIDHIGCLTDIVKASHHPIEVHVYEFEKPYINGEKVPVKVAQVNANFDSLSEEMKHIMSYHCVVTSCDEIIKVFIILF